MPFILAALALLGALIYGAVRLYMLVSAPFGMLAGGAAVLAAAAVLAGLARHALHHYRAIHGVSVNGRRTQSLAGSWGSLTLEIEQKTAALAVDGQALQFVFADIVDATPLEHSGAWTVVLRLNHHAQAVWSLPMVNAAAARRWAKVLSMASTQTL